MGIITLIFRTWEFNKYINVDGINNSTPSIRINITTMGSLVINTTELKVDSFCYAFIAL